MVTPSAATPVQRLLSQLYELRDAVATEGAALCELWKPYSHRRAFRLGALNLAHYLALRKRDLRDLQSNLMVLGLSSLGRAEARVMPNLNAVIHTLEGLNGQLITPVHRSDFFRGERLLRGNTDQVFGIEPENRRVRIMVTLPTEAAADGELVRDLVERGMDCARINCSHDSPVAWSAMIAHIRRAAHEVGRPVKILMDLGGPKPRTADVIAPKKTRLQVGDHLLLTRETPQKNKKIDFQARCAIPEVIDQLEAGKHVWMDDGKVAMLIEDMRPEGALVRVEHAPLEGYKLKDEKGLNFPDIDLQLSPLTDEDLTALDFVALNADMIGYSFVQSGEDVALLQSELNKRLADPTKITIIAKIETPRAVRNLPEIMVRAAGVQPFGVMIARGDLAVELGFQRTAEMQEEILWLCEAAHVPVIWATQVMESFVKTGTPSRGEMTDVAMSSRAECVMLNKGAFIGEAVTVIDDVLRRMQEHHVKKTPQMRALRAWDETTG